jgi:hypothetical protein
MEAVGTQFKVHAWRKTTKNSSQHDWYPGRDLNLRSPEYEAEVFITRERRSGTVTSRKDTKEE